MWSIFVGDVTKHLTLMYMTRKKSSTIIYYVVILCTYISIFPLYLTATTFLTHSAVTSDTSPLQIADLSPVPIVLYGGTPQTSYGATTLHRIDDKVALPLLALVFGLLLGCALFHIVCDWLGLKSSVISMR